MWSTTAVNTTLCTTRTPASDDWRRELPQGRICDFYLENPHFSIKYNVRASSVDDSGNEIVPLACGSTVPQGTRVKFEIVPHTYQDVYWLATGGAMDDPYGDWITDAAGPTPVACHPKDYLGRFRQEDDDNPEEWYLPFVVDPPAKSIMTSDGLSCTGILPKVCTATGTGVHLATFSFAGTVGKFYARATEDSKHEVARNPLACAEYPASNNHPLVTLRADEVRVLKSGGDIDDATHFSLAMKDMRRYNELLDRVYMLDVPARVLACPITFSATDTENQPPSTPSLSSVGACTVGTPHSINFVSADPDGDNVRYGIDWDADGSIDQWMPPSGYIASEASQTASRTYATAGEKTAKVMAQDEGGLSSDWATLTFSCAENPPPAGQCSDGGDNDNDGLVDSLDPDCTATAGLSEFPTGQQPPSSPSPSSLNGILNLRVLPSLVRGGSTTNVNWSAQNVESCAVQGTNGDSWTGAASPIGGQQSSAITGETRYTLSCIDLEGATLTKTATVRTIPSWRER